MLHDGVNKSKIVSFFKRKKWITVYSEGIKTEHFIDKILIH